MSLKWLKGATMVLAFWLSASAQASVSPGPVTLQAHDGVSISGLVYEARQPKGIILLFHQAGSSKAEYATIAPRLAAAGFTALAIDQRSGGTLYGPNETVSRLGRAATYEEAKADLEAALDWALPRNLPIILWGSSYSAALVFEVGAEHMNQVNAILAFSPGEYLDTSGAVARAAGRVQVPIYVTSSSDADEIQAGREILSAAPARVKAQFVPKFGVHGSSTLDRDPQSQGSGRELEPCSGVPVSAAQTARMTQSSSCVQPRCTRNTVAKTVALGPGVLACRIQKPSNRALDFVILAFARMAEHDVAALVDDILGRPVLIAPGIPRRRTHCPAPPDR